VACVAVQMRHGNAEASKEGKIRQQRINHKQQTHHSRDLSGHKDNNIVLPGERLSAKRPRRKIRRKRRQLVRKDEMEDNDRHQGNNDDDNNTPNEAQEHIVTHLVLLDDELKDIVRYFANAAEEVQQGSYDHCEDGDSVTINATLIDQLCKIACTEKKVRLVKESWIGESVRSGYLLHEEEFVVDLDRMRNKVETLIVPPTPSTATRARKRKRRRVDLTSGAGKNRKKRKKEPVELGDKNVIMDEETPAKHTTATSKPKPPVVHNSLHFESPNNPSSSISPEKSDSSQKDITTCGRISQSSLDDTDIVLVLPKSTSLGGKSKNSRLTCTSDPSKHTLMTPRTPTRTRHTKRSTTQPPPSLHPSFDYFLSKNSCDFMESCFFYFSGSSKSRIVELSLDLHTRGATIMPLLNRRVTHVILASSLEHDYQLPRQEFNFIQQNPQLKIVTPKWLTACIEAHALVHESKYFIPIEKLSNRELRLLEESIKTRDLFLGKSFLLHSSLSERDSEWLNHIIQFCSGHIVDNMQQCEENRVDFVVSPFHTGTLIDTLNSQMVGAHVTLHYIQDCIEEGRLFEMSVDRRFYWSPLMFEKSMHGWVDIITDRKGIVPMFCTEGLTGRCLETVPIVLDVYGCACCEEWNEDTCDILIVERSKTLSHSLMQKIQQDKIRIVDTEWIASCADSGYMFDIPELSFQDLFGALCGNGALFDEDHTMHGSTRPLSTLSHAFPTELPISNTPTGIQDEELSDSYHKPDSGYISEEFDEDEEAEEELPEGIIEMINATRSASLNAHSLKSGSAQADPHPANVNREMLRRGMTQHHPRTLPVQSQNVVLVPQHTFTPNTPIIFVPVELNEKRMSDIKNLLARLRWRSTDILDECTHVVVGLKPSLKSHGGLLYMASQKVIVDHEWLDSCDAAGQLVPVTPFLKAHIWEKPPFQGWVVFPQGWRQNISAKVLNILLRGRARMWHHGMDPTQVTHILKDNGLKTLQDLNFVDELNKQNPKPKTFEVKKIQEYLRNPEEHPM